MNASHPQLLKPQFKKIENGHYHNVKTEGTVSIKIAKGTHQLLHSRCLVTSLGNLRDARLAQKTSFKEAVSVSWPWWLGQQNGQVQHEILSSWTSKKRGTFKDLGWFANRTLLDPVNHHPLSKLIRHRGACPIVSQVSEAITKRDKSARKWGATAKMQKDVCQDQTSRYRSREMCRHRAKPYKVRGQLLRGRPKNRILLVTVVNIILQDHFLPSGKIHEAPINLNWDIPNRWKQWDLQILVLNSQESMSPHRNQSVIFLRWIYWIILDSLMYGNSSIKPPTKDIPR